MNVKKVIVSWAITAVLMVSSLPISAQTGYQDPQTQANLNFEFTSILGTIIDEAKNPVPGIKVEIELAPIAELRAELNSPPSQLEATLQGLNNSVGNGVFVTSTSNEKGEYIIKGVPIPGVYYIFLRNSENYLPTRLKLNLNPTEGKEYKAPPMILNSRKANGPVISEKAMKEVEKSRKAMAAKKIKDAIKFLEKALIMEPEYAEGHYNLAILFMEAKNRPEAIAHLEKAVAIQENYKPALKTLGELFLFAKDFQKAADYYSRYLAICEKDSSLSLEDIRVYFYVGNCYRGLKQMDKAIIYFSRYMVNKEKVSQLEKKDALIAIDIASYYYQKSDMKNSAAYYKRAITADPGVNAEVYMYLGNASVFSRDGKNALTYYKKYMELEPKGKFAGQVKAMIEKLTPMYKTEEEKK